MSSNWTRRSRDWSPEPAPESATVSQKRNNGTALMNSDDIIFVALYTSLTPERSGLPDELYDALNHGIRNGLYSFSDGVNPFYEDYINMYGVRESEADVAVDIIRRHGYGYEYRDNVAQFKFTPRPTVGEIVITGKNATE